MRLQPGTFLQGDKYRIIDVLGQGGFGITYLAEQVMAERKVCIKEFFPKEYYKRDEDSHSISLGTQGSAEIMDLYKAKFVKEAKTIAKLDHPNIIHIFDVFTENNTAYYVMEYIDGESLSDVVKRNGSALAEGVAVDYIKQAASALGYIHERKIMHLDVKPANIMLRKEDGRPILIDFGLSKQYDAEGNQTSSTPVGISAGYAPMEQYQQGGVKEFSPETDIYSLGASLYYLVTGCVPPQAAAIVDDGLPELPAHLSANVRNAIERSMEVQRKKRPHSMDEFVAILGDGNTAPAAPVVNNVAATAAPSVEDESTKIGVSEDDQSTKIDASYTPTTKQNHKSPSTENATTDVEEKRPTIRWGLWLCGIGIVVIIITSILLNRPKDSAESDSQSTTLMRSLSTQDSRQKMKKYSDMLELPHGLDGYFDLDEAIAAAKREHKPLFIDVTGHACNNCREMEFQVWSDKRVMNLLENKYIICALYIDDKMELAPEDYYTSAEGNQMTTLGLKNFYIAKERWNVTSQPGYVLVTPDGKAMLMPEAMGYERDINKFVKYLETGLQNFEQGINYAFERPKIMDEVEELLDDAQAEWSLTAFEVEAGVYELHFVATINPGFHGYPLTDYMSSPIFTWENDSILVGEMTEPLASTLHNGEYEGKAEYVQRVKGNNGDVVKVNVLSTFCQGNMCTSSDCNFTLVLN